MFKRDDRVFVNHTSGFHKGAYGAVTSNGTNQYNKTVVYVQRDGSTGRPMWFHPSELDLIEKGQQMKSTKIDGPCEPTITYPCLMISTLGAVVLISGRISNSGIGTVVHETQSSNFPVGTHKTCWDMQLLKPFKGSVCLEN